MANNNKRLKGPGKTGAIVALCIVLVLTVVCGILGVNGMKLDSRGLWKLLPWLPTTDAENWPQSLPLGLDLRGGVYVEYSAEKPDEIEGSFASLMDATVSVIQQRVTDKGYPECTVQKIENGTGIRVEVPDVTDPQALLDLIGTPAKLSFRGPDGVEFMTGKEVQTAVAGQYEGEYVISFTLNSEGARLFADKTRASVGQTISIYLDDEMIISPRVQNAITDGKGIINGMGNDLERAQRIAAQIQSGSLPLVLTQQKVDTVSATLGDTALSTSILAALIGIGIIMLIMIIRYRLNGVVASWALCIYIIVLFFLIAVIPGIQLTLPGLAGIVLGIGMAVDANVIIYERFNEELRMNRTAKAAARAGFKNAMSAIIDANVTTMIAGFVLLIFGTGSVQGFAKTLLLGVVVSILTAVLVTRFLMTRFIAAGAENPALYCKVEPKTEEEVQNA